MSAVAKAEAFDPNYSFFTLPSFILFSIQIFWAKAPEMPKPSFPLFIVCESKYANKGKTNCIQSADWHMEHTEACTVNVLSKQGHLGDRPKFLAHKHMHTHTHTVSNQIQDDISDLFLCKYNMDTPLSWTHTRQTIIRPCHSSLIAMYSSSYLISYQTHWLLWISRAHWSTASVWSQPISRVSLTLSLSVSLALIWRRTSWIKLPGSTSLVKAVLHNQFQFSTVDTECSSFWWQTIFCPVRVKDSGFIPAWTSLVVCHSGVGSRVWRVCVFLAKWWFSVCIHRYIHYVPGQDRDLKHLLTVN